MIFKTKHSDFKQSLDLNLTYGYDDMMPRPHRIQYEGACYHVSNKSAGSRPIVACDQHREFFVKLLQEIHEEFQAEIHAWCLMDDSYHLLLSTPLANLSKAMRHLNGVYTQKINRTENTTGSVFKSRYKSILIDPSHYLTHVGRKIHLTPIVAKIVQDVSEYLWSSYRSYVGDAEPPQWLCTKHTLDMLKEHGGLYLKYMETEEDEFVSSFYQKKRLGNVLGDDAFQKNIKKLYPVKKDTTDKQNVIKITSKRICKAIADEFQIHLDEVYESKRGNTNIARLIAVYLHHVYGQYTQIKIAEIFDFKQAGSVGSSIYRYKKLRVEFIEIQEIESSILKNLNNK